MERLNFDDQISANKWKSFFLVVVIVLFFLAIGYVVSMFYDPSYFFSIMIIAIIVSIGYTFVSYYFSDKIALASVNATEASRTEHRMLYHSVESMSLASGLSMPRVYVMQSSQINAFASGRNPQNAVICVTTGALEKLNKQELEGVIAHEMAHIANFDIRYITLTAVMVGMVAIASEIFLRSLWFSDSGKENKNGIFIIIGIALAILAPIATQLVSLAISRKREFMADATGVKFTRYSQGLIYALKKIGADSISEKDAHRYSKAMAPLFISNPFSAKKISGLFSTHPPLAVRIEKLERM